MNGPRSLQVHVAFPRRDKLSFLWLAVGFGVLIFADGMFIIPIATWVAPVFVVRFLRTQKVLPGLGLGYLAAVLAFYISCMPAFLDAGAMFAVYSVFFALVCFVPYAVDRLLYPRIQGFAGTLALPLAWVSMEYVLHLVSPLRTFFLVPYTQYSNLALLQIMSVTGLWSITFLIGWFASVVNHAWEHAFQVRVIGRGVGLYAGILLAVLFFGGMRLALFPYRGETVQVAVLTANVDREVIPDATTETYQHMVSGTLTEAERQDISQAMAEINTDLLERTRLQARSGSKIVTWTEYNAHAWKSTETQFVDQARQLAREEGIYLVFPLAVIYDSLEGRLAPQLAYENKSVALTPDGEIAYVYMKHNLLIGPESENAVRGPRQVYTVDTPYGRLSSVTCLDMEVPSFMRLAGQERVDIVLSGAIDGTPSTRGNPLHSIMASYRAIEDGFSLARGGFYGRNVAVDYHGHILAQSNHYTASDRSVVAQVSIKGTRTLYSILGDFFPWLCIAGLASLVLLVVFPKRLPERGKEE